ncbi:MAG: class I SAM-dependent methyltransferase [Tissierella sp.]|uniref:class I SAM-dependent methyltransferase n=2 Tax=Bacillota TaxID=1239 RepID=UPI003F983FB1
MNYKKLKEEWKKEEQHTFKGWDFSHIDDRYDSEELPWVYKEIILNHLKPSDKLLDMGTGGGEFLLTLNHTYELTSVTEAYPPNVELCKKELSPMGIEVKQVIEDSNIPYSNDKFDIVINKHESFDVKEVKRILKKDGFFITQQVGGKNNNDLSSKLIDNLEIKDSKHNLENNIKLLKEAGFEILYTNEYFPKNKFYDIGALVYFAKIIEWEFPNFSVDSCFDSLCKLQKELEDKGYVTGTEHRFIIVAKKK